MASGNVQCATYTATNGRSPYKNHPVMSNVRSVMYAVTDGCSLYKIIR